MRSRLVMLTSYLVLAGCSKKPAPPSAAPPPPVDAPTAPSSPAPHGDGLTQDELETFTDAMCKEFTFDAGRLAVGMTMVKNGQTDPAALLAAGQQSDRLRAELKATLPDSPRFKQFQQLTQALFEVAALGRHVKTEKPVSARHDVFTDSFVAREDDILERLNACAAKVIGTFDHPSPPPPAEFFCAVDVRLGMTELEVERALKVKPADRKQNGVSVDASYKVNGTVGAVARFSGDALVSIAFGRDVVPHEASITRQVANSISQGPLAMKSINYTLHQKDPLTMKDLVEQTRGPGQRIGWKLFAQADGTPEVSTTWVWPTDGKDGLIAVETGGAVEQPIVRPVLK